jgi:SAM-dependent methyltransferase
MSDSGKGKSVCGPGGPDWVRKHRDAWRKKRTLRHYYQREIFERILRQLNGGRILELGSGPGFFASYHRGMLRSDVVPVSGLDLCFDVHDIPIADETIDAVVGVDVLHHFARPGRALCEIARLLRPNGRLVLVEPWTGPMGFLFYRLVHHEDCYGVADPWREAFPKDKAPMEGNAHIPKSILVERAAELAVYVPNLMIRRVEPFGVLSYLLTGGFQNWGFPSGVSVALAALEHHLPPRMMSFLATRALFVLEKKGPGL